ncbi:MAG TPA: prepilin-type N-terminal cleavage/methylation domain-containing protein [Candidatus Methylacidiphilales bacterium]|nr:prepilin-type N-terminal cleavage/methylation domain-containing protein [Candidatus Methylacidiphilales bacterium]
MCCLTGFLVSFRRIARMVQSRKAFTLIELLVATVILLAIMAIVMHLVGGIGQIWKSSTGKISAFRNARAAFTTVSGTLSRATLNTYNDYVDASGKYRTATAATFFPQQFARTSDLHFIAGPATSIVPGAVQTTNPGHAIFFQAPLGDTNSDNLSTLNRSLNSVGFYIQYGLQIDTNVVPPWLQPLAETKRRYRLVQFVEPTENLKVYGSTANTAYTLTWLQSFKTPFDAAQQPRARILAEDVTLLVLRPRLSPKDEEAAVVKLGVLYPATARGSILSPNYHYDSRAWQDTYPAAARVKAAPSPVVRSGIMRNQVPPIVDVAMVSVDPQSLARLDMSTDTPPALLQVPTGLFADSSKMDQDLQTYCGQLNAAGIRYRLFRTSVTVQGSKWSTD